MPRVGSSRIRTFGAGISHFANSTFCWLPPDRVLVSCSTLVATTRIRAVKSLAIRPSRARSTSPSRLASRRRIGSVSFARMGNGSTNPCWWRSSGRNESPSRIASRGEHNGTWPPSKRISPRLGDVMPKSIWATSERPAPTRPKKPRISPARTSKVTSSTNPAPERPRALRSDLPICAFSFGKKAAGSVPIMWRTVCSGVSSGAGAVLTGLPERKIVTSSPSPRISSMKWLMKRIATPCVFNL